MSWPWRTEGRGADRRNLRSVRHSVPVRFAVLSALALSFLGAGLERSLNQMLERRALAATVRLSEITAAVTVKHELREDDLTSGLSAARADRLRDVFATVLATGGVRHVAVINRQQRIVFADERRLIGTRAAASPALADALADIAVAAPPDDDLGVLSVFVPLRYGAHPPSGAVALTLPAEPLAGAVAADQRQLSILLVAGLIILWLVLFRIVRGAAARLERQVLRNQHQATHDALTGLPNRVLLHDRTEQALASARRRDATVAVALIDLDHFKDINDTLGHHQGDAILRDIAKRIGPTVREADTFARLGGDEFALLLRDVNGADEAIAATERALSTLDDAFPVGSMWLHVDASAGIALSPHHGDDVETIMQRADVAMYLAKDLHSTVEVYRPDRDHHSADRLALISDLHRAVHEGQLVVMYQPKADLRSGTVTGVEALVRWDHPERGLLGPDHFIPTAEKSGVIVPLTYHVIEEAVAAAARCEARGHRLSMAVNLSAASLQDPELPDRVAATLHRHGLPAERLVLELTESAILTDPDRAAALLHQIEELGVQLSIDDFGTGFSSLANLQRLSVDELKIDKSFVQSMTTSESDAVIVRSTVDLGRNLGLRVVAEGVEDDLTRDLLASLDCDVFQGYLLSRPVIFEQLIGWLEARPAATDRTAKRRRPALSSRSPG